MKFLLSLPLMCAAAVAAEIPAPHMVVLKDNERLVAGELPTAQQTQDVVRLRGWRGERVSAQVVAWSEVFISKWGGRPGGIQCSALSPEGGHAALQPRCYGVGTTKAHGKLVADVLGNGRLYADAFPGNNAPHAFMVQLDIPADAAPGVYRGTLKMNGGYVGKPYYGVVAPVEIPVELVVEQGVLPAPKDWQFHLDLWQQPQSIARWHQVTPWSAEHFEAMRPYMRMLAQAGQKVITCTLLDEAWNGQTHDDFPSYIEWIKGKDGEWRYDFSAFDAWVSFMMNEIGITEQISCYTMVPWHMKVRYLNESTGKYEFIKLDVNSPVWEQTWGPFLSAFRAHLLQKGWLHQTCIALDERPDHMARAAKAMVDRYAPELRVVSAVDKPSAFTREVYDLSAVITHADSVMGELLAERKARGKKTTVYVCLHPQKPNTFTFSPPAEAEWIGLFVAANGLDGFLRWAYNSWNEAPLRCTDFGKWPSGDCFLVYPGACSSIRFERLRDGIEDAEKIRILRERAAAIGTPEAQTIIDKLNARLRAIFTVARSKGNTHGEDVRRANELISEATENLFRL